MLSTFQNGLPSLIDRWKMMPSPRDSVRTGEQGFGRQEHPTHGLIRAPAFPRRFSTSGETPHRPPCTSIILNSTPDCCAQYAPRQASSAEMSSSLMSSVLKQSSLSRVAGVRTFSSSVSRDASWGFIGLGAMGELKTSGENKQLLTCLRRLFHGEKLTSKDP